jgi:hypothetical protein
MVFFKEDLQIIVGYFGSQNSTDERMEIRTTEFMNYEMHLIQKHSRTWRIAPHKPLPVNGVVYPKSCLQFETSAETLYILAFHRTDIFPPLIQQIVRIALKCSSENPPVPLSSNRAGFPFRRTQIKSIFTRAFCMVPASRYPYSVVQHTCHSTVRSSTPQQKYLSDQSCSKPGTARTLISNPPPLCSAPSSSVRNPVPLDDRLHPKYQRLRYCNTNSRHSGFLLATHWLNNPNTLRVLIFDE